MHVEKEKLNVEIFTTNHRIVGEIYVFPGARLTDTLSARESQSFIPLTNVEAYNLHTGEPVFSTSFANINRSHIVLIRPKEETKRE